MESNESNIQNIREKCTKYLKVNSKSFFSTTLIIIFLFGIIFYLNYFAIYEIYSAYFLFELSMYVISSIYLVFWLNMLGKYFLYKKFSSILKRIEENEKLDQEQLDYLDNIKQSEGFLNFFLPFYFFGLVIVYQAIKSGHHLAAQGNVFWSMQTLSEVIPILSLLIIHIGILSSPIFRDIPSRLTTEILCLLNHELK